MNGLSTQASHQPVVASELPGWSLIEWSTSSSYSEKAKTAQWQKVEVNPYEIVAPYIAAHDQQKVPIANATNNGPKGDCLWYSGYSLPSSDKDMLTCNFLKSSYSEIRSTDQLLTAFQHIDSPEKAVSWFYFTRNAPVLSPKYVTTIATGYAILDVTHDTCSTPSDITRAYYVNVTGEVTEIGKQPSKTTCMY